MTTCSINLAQMAELVSALETASTELPVDRGRLTWRLEYVWLSAYQARRTDPVAGWAQEELPGVRRRLALARQIEASEPGIQTTVTIDEDAISTATPQEARERADRAAELIADYGDGDVPAELVELLAENSSDPYFAAQFASLVTPEQLSEAILGMSAARVSMAEMAFMDSDRERIEEWDTAYESMLDDLGTTLGTASFGTGDLAPPEGAAQDWLAAITDEYAPGQAGALGLVISRGTFSDEFIGEVASGLLDHEINYGVEDMWMDRSWGLDYDGAIDPVHGDDEGDPTGYTQYYDPMTGVMDALSRSPGAATDVFGSGLLSTVQIEDEDVDVNAYLKYVLMERKWPIDQGDAGYAAVATAMTPYEGGSTLSSGVAADAMNVLTAFEEEILERTENKNPVSEFGHLVLDVLGMVPFIGEPVDAINAFWYYAEGDVVNGSLTAAAMVPFGGWIAVGGKWIRRGDAAADIAAGGLRLDGVPDLARVSDGPGNFRRVNDRHSATSAAYQQQVSGFPSDFTYNVNGVEFDGYLDDVLLEAKGPNYAWMVTDGQFRPGMNVIDGSLDQARRQIQAADGVPVQWHVMEPEAAQAFRDLFRREGIDIEVIHAPFTG